MMTGKQAAIRLSDNPTYNTALQHRPQEPKATYWVWIGLKFRRYAFSQKLWSPPWIHTKVLLHAHKYRCLPDHHMKSKLLGYANNILNESSFVHEAKQLKKQQHALVLDKHVTWATCQCGEEDHTIKHIIQNCKRHDEKRSAAWPTEVTLNQKIFWKKHYMVMRRTSNDQQSASLRLAWQWTRRRRWRTDVPCSFLTYTCTIHEPFSVPVTEVLTAIMK